MNTKHTPGPWKVLDHAIVAEKLNSFGNWIVTELPVRYTISPPVDEDKANARLIAAAPEMLEALKELYRCLSAITQPGEFEKELYAAKQAIAKAEGK